MPGNEMNRLMALWEFDLDYLDLGPSFADLTKLAAKVAGTSVSLINLIDSFTQWSVSSFGIDIRQFPREDSICQYTILEDNLDGFEVADLSSDDRFKSKPYVKGDPNLKYYYGIPLKFENDLSLGTLCVMHSEHDNLSIEKKEMLDIIANEVVNRIKTHHAISKLKTKANELESVKNRLAHDIRGPIAGIVGLSEIILMEGQNNRMVEVLRFIELIQKSGKTVLELSDEILSQNPIPKVPVTQRTFDDEFTLLTLKNKLGDMFGPLAILKNVLLVVNFNPAFAEIPFPKNKILQIMGNLISNAIKFTPLDGKVEVVLDMEVLDQRQTLSLKVKDNGAGLSQDLVSQILAGKASSSMGTAGEKGYGFGLILVSQLVKGLRGKWNVTSTPGQGTEFELMLPLGS